MQSEWDVIVVGSGGGGLLAALRAADHGLSVLVVEKAALYGGTTATSGGAIWIPCHGLNGHQDSREQALAYLQATAGPEADPARVDAYLDNGPATIAYLAERGVACDMLEGFPDYYPEAPGSVPGRALIPREIGGKALGDDYVKMRPPFAAFLLFGRYSLDLVQSFALTARLPGWRRLVAKMLARYWLDLPWRLKTRRDARATMGNALIGGLRLALKQRGVPVWLETPLKALCSENGRVTGIDIEQNGQPISLTARRGVILAAGGFEQSKELRDANLPVTSEPRWSLTPPGGNTGDALVAARSIGAATGSMDRFWWSASTQLPSRADPSVTDTHQMFFDHRHPHSLVVNGRGERFLNESCTYDDFGKGMIADQQRTGANLPCWLVFDATYRARYGAGGVLPSFAMPDAAVPSSWWDRWFFKASSVAELAAKIGMPADALEASAATITQAARDGRDPQFGRGVSHYDQFFGDASVTPNPALGAVDKPPFYAIRIDLGDLGTKGGLQVDARARVLSKTGEPIAGLYAVGNNAVAPFADCYPGSGGTIGPALVFGYIAGDDVAGHID